MECPVCQVEIAGEVVYFSHGNPGTKARLKARVCQYAAKPGCINDYTGVITEDDEFGNFPQKIIDSLNSAKL